MSSDRPPESPFSMSGFLGAAVAAPGAAVVLFVAGAFASAVFSTGIRPEELGSGLFGLVVMFTVATVCGAAPSVVFGSLVLAVMQRAPWRRRPTPMIFMAGGLTAAGLYVLAALGAAAVSPGAVRLFAPWATADMMRLAGAWWAVSSIVLAGGAAGLFYGLCVKRG